MIRFGRLLLATAALTGCSLAEPVTAPAFAQAAPAPAPAATPARDADPALWVVRDEDTTIYLFGTVHVLPQGLSWFDEAVREAFDRSDTLVLEMVQPSQQQMQQLVVSTALDTTGRPISSRLTEAQRTKLAANLATVQQPANAVDPFEPWFASTMLALLPLPKLGFDPASGAEEQLQVAARAANKPIVGLETAEQQIGFLDALPEPVQMRMLVSAIEDFDEIGPKFNEMIAEWSAGNPDALAETINEEMGQIPEVAKVMLTDRNARWADWIAERMARPGTVFMAVGAGHLAGDGSVQQQLRRHSLNVERVAY